MRSKKKAFTLAEMLLSLVLMSVCISLFMLVFANRIQQEYKSHRDLKVVAWCMGEIFDSHFGKIKKAGVVAIIDEKKSLEIDSYKGILII